MRKQSVLKVKIYLFFLTLMMVFMACQTYTGLYTECEEVDRDYYEVMARHVGQTPEIPKYPDGAVYKVCYTDGEITSVQMKDGEKPDEQDLIPAGTYTGESSFHTTLDDDWDGNHLEPVCTANTIQVVVGSDGTAQGEIRSICYVSQDSDSEEMGMTHHSEVTGVIQGELLGKEGQLTISYTWHSYITSPQWETSSLDQTVESVFPYHVLVSDNVMTLTPAAEVEEYYSFTLHKE